MGTRQVFAGIGPLTETIPVPAEYSPVGEFPDRRRCVKAYLPEKLNVLFYFLLTLEFSFPFLLLLLVVLFPLVLFEF